MTEPTRETWREHCAEPPLTDEEVAGLEELMEARNAERINGPVYRYIAQATEAEWAVVRCIEDDRVTRTTLVGHAQWIDAHTRLARAELAAWREWQARERAETGERDVAGRFVAG
jgi:hypothetical protein